MVCLLTIQVAELPRDWPHIQAIRRQVFQVGQGIDPLLDFDGRDEAAQQLLAWWHGAAVGTARIRFLEEGTTEATAKLERLAVLPAFRNRGIGRQLMERALECLRSAEIIMAIVHAQAYLQGFYEQLGFEPMGDRFEEAGIPHVKMKQRLRSHR